ncbi:MAG: class I SAM-dependent methyltransferase [Ferruginibacter sp.]|nr:class I SAM-dependent methyltransferase [Chitinophagaceae bacterium]
MSLKPEYCPVCKQKNISTWSVAKDYEYFSVPGEFTYYKCGDCGTIFIYPIPVDQLRKIYPSNYYSFTNKAGNLVVRIKEWLDKRFFKKILDDITGKEISVLDVGGGTGWMLDVLKKSDKRISHTQIVDIDDKAGNIARQHGHSYFEGTIEAFQTDRLFHLILMLNLVEHVAAPLAVLQKARSLLAPGGMIVIKTPNTNSWDARLFKKTYWGGLHCPRHWIIFSEKSFRIVIQPTGLKIMKLNYTQGAPFWAFSIIAALHRRKIVHVSAKRPVIFHWLFAPISALFAVFDFIRRPFARTSQMFIILTKEV